MVLGIGSVLDEAVERGMLLAIAAVVSLRGGVAHTATSLTPGGGALAGAVFPRNLLGTDGTAIEKLAGAGTCLGGGDLPLQSL